MADFSNSYFFNKAYFDSVIFKAITEFQNSNFLSVAHFENTICKETINFSKIKFSSIKFFNSEFKNSHFLGIANINTRETLKHYKKIPNIYFDVEYYKNKEKVFKAINKDVTLPNKMNFTDKETARIIKSNFEKQNNITEANKYFRIEQELYLYELKYKKSFEENRVSIKTILYLNKFVSNFGTDWIRPIFVMFSFGFLASFLYILFSNNPTLFIFEQYPITTKDILLWTGGGFFISIVIYLLYYYKKWWLLILFLSGYIGILIFNQDLRLITNDISKLINPLNIFKGKEYFEDIAPYGMFVKLIMATLIYQFIMAFRQNTRRK